MSGADRTANWTPSFCFSISVPLNCTAWLLPLLRHGLPQLDPVREEAHDLIQVTGTPVSKFNVGDINYHCTRNHNTAMRCCNRLAISSAKFATNISNRMPKQIPYHPTPEPHLHACAHRRMARPACGLCAEGQPDHTPVAFWVAFEIGQRIPMFSASH